MGWETDMELVSLSLFFFLFWLFRWWLVAPSPEMRSDPFRELAWSTPRWSKIKHGGAGIHGWECRGPTWALGFLLGCGSWVWPASSPAGLLATACVDPG